MFTQPLNPPAAQVESDDDALIQAASQGDGSAYALLVRKYQTRLGHALRRVCKSLVDVQDVMQEAFLRAYLKLNGFQRASSFYTWLYRIAVNINISRHRRRQAKALDLTNFQGNGKELVDQGESQHDRLLRQQRVEQVQRAVADLSSQHQAVLVLREFEGHDYDEIANILQLPLGTVRSRLHRARLQLRESLACITC